MSRRPRCLRTHMGFTFSQPYICLNPVFIDFYYLKEIKIPRYATLAEWLRRDVQVVMGISPRGFKSRR